MSGDGGLRRSRRFPRSWRSLVAVITVIIMLALCAGAFYALGGVEESATAGIGIRHPL